MNLQSRSSRATTNPIPCGSGIEIGSFRLRPGVSEATMREAHAAMVEGFLSQLPGWRAQHLVRLDEGRFCDIAFAGTRERSEALCQSWSGNVLCDAFLALIEAEELQFGTVL